MVCCILTQIASETKGTKTLFEMTILKGTKSHLAPFELNPESFSTLKKLLRITSWAMRFIQKSRNLYNQKGELTAQEIQQAKVVWIKYVQIENHEILNKMKSSLNIQFDKANVMRCHGRFATKEFQPIILPKNNPFMFLVIDQVHRSLMHAGVCHTLADTLSEFWIPQ